MLQNGKTRKHLWSLATGILVLLLYSLSRIANEQRHTEYMTTAFKGVGRSNANLETFYTYHVLENTSPRADKLIFTVTLKPQITAIPPNLTFNRLSLLKKNCKTQYNSVIKVGIIIPGNFFANYNCIKIISLGISTKITIWETGYMTHIKSSKKFNRSNNYRYKPRVICQPYISDPFLTKLKPVQYSFCSKHCWLGRNQVRSSGNCYSQGQVQDDKGEKLQILIHLNGKWEWDVNVASTAI